MRHARIMVSTALASTLAFASLGCGDTASEAPKADKMDGPKMDKMDKMEGDKMAPGKMEGDKMERGKMEGGKMEGDKMAPPK